jgi:hypothetical protein
MTGTRWSVSTLKAMLGPKGSGEIGSDERRRREAFKGTVHEILLAEVVTILTRLSPSSTHVDLCTLNLVYVLMR